MIQILWITSTIMILISGIYFSIKLKFIHLNPKKLINAVKEKTTTKDSINSIQALTMTLAGRIGVGSLAGIALAVYIGGPGVIFWIWITSLICAPNAYAESVLSVIYRKKDYKNIYRGGPFYYIKEGINNNKLAITYAVIVLISYIGGFLTMQVNTVSKSINQIIQINPIIIGTTISILAGITIFGGVKKIADTTSKLVPIMTIFYLSICIFIITKNITQIPYLIQTIINSALNIKTFGTGTITTMLIGMQKGIFSNEAGLGTGSIAAATADISKHNNGLSQVLGIHIENLLIATLTVLVICLSNYNNIIIEDANGIELTLYAFKYHLGNIGPIFIIITIILFAISTILTGYYYGESSLKFIKNTNKKDITILKITTIILLTISSIISSNILWIIIDFLVAILAIINIYALFKLRKKVT